MCYKVFVIFKIKPFINVNKMFDIIPKGVYYMLGTQVQKSTKALKNAVLLFIKPEWVNYWRVFHVGR